MARKRKNKEQLEEKKANDSIIENIEDTTTNIPKKVEKQIDNPIKDKVVIDKKISIAFIGFLFSHSNPFLKQEQINLIKANYKDYKVIYGENISASIESAYNARFYYINKFLNNNNKDIDYVVYIDPYIDKIIKEDFEKLFKENVNKDLFIFNKDLFAFKVKSLKDNQIKFNSEISLTTNLKNLSKTYSSLFIL